MKNTKNESLRPFGLQFLEIPERQLADANGGCEKPKKPLTTQAETEPSVAGGRPDHF